MSTSFFIYGKQQRIEKETKMSDFSFVPFSIRCSPLILYNLPINNELMFGLLPFVGLGADGAGVAKALPNICLSLIHI